jgi:hypothetical protein
MSTQKYLSTARRDLKCTIQPELVIHLTLYLEKDGNVLTNTQRNRSGTLHLLAVPKRAGRATQTLYHQRPMGPWGGIELHNDVEVVQPRPGQLGGGFGRDMSVGITISVGFPSRPRTVSERRINSKQRNRADFLHHKRRCAYVRATPQRDNDPDPERQRR